MTDSCTCCCGSKKAEEKKPVDPKVEEAKELKKEEVEAVEPVPLKVNNPLSSE